MTTAGHFKLYGMYLQLNIPRLRRVGLQAAPEWPIDQPAIPAA